MCVWIFVGDANLIERAYSSAASALVLERKAVNVFFFFFFGKTTKHISEA